MLMLGMTLKFLLSTSVAGVAPPASIICAPDLLGGILNVLCQLPLVSASSYSRSCCRYKLSRCWTHWREAGAGNTEVRAYVTLLRIQPYGRSTLNSLSTALLPSLSSTLRFPRGDSGTVNTRFARPEVVPWAISCLSSPSKSGILRCRSWLYL